ncbi:MAG: toll/interleukin-1 receptor domain-containing protein, partial [Symploca sp. SIO2G7]|nr:toll/interleukin-1 receptor domain-containing protein [Symploca sp. SIO2G7]
MTSFFVSYNRADKAWAEWIAWILEEAGHTAVIQAWDFRPGGNFVLDMQRAAAETDKTLMVLSQDYLKSAFTQPEWAAAFAKDPIGSERQLMPVRVQECQPDALLGTIVYVDLVGLEEEAAQQAILNALLERAKPGSKPAFPISNQPKPPRKPPVFPAAKPQDFQELGIARPLEMETLEPAEALAFLWRRSGQGESSAQPPAEENAEIEAAKELAEELGYLPLALEQA